MGTKVMKTTTLQLHHCRLLHTFAVARLFLSRSIIDRVSQNVSKIFLPLMKNIIRCNMKCLCIYWECYSIYVFHIVVK